MHGPILSTCSCDLYWLVDIKPCFGCKSSWWAIYLFLKGKLTRISKFCRNLGKPELVTGRKNWTLQTWYLEKVDFWNIRTLKYRVCFSFVNFGFSHFHRNLDFQSIPVLETKMKGYCSWTTCNKICQLNWWLMFLMSDLEFSQHVLSVGDIYGWLSKCWQYFR